MNDERTLHAVAVKLEFAEHMMRDFTVHRSDTGELFSTYIRRQLTEAAELMIAQARHNRGLVERL